MNYVDVRIRCVIEVTTGLICYRAYLYPKRARDCYLRLTGAVSTGSYPQCSSDSRAAKPFMPAAWPSGAGCWTSAKSLLIRKREDDRHWIVKPGQPFVGGNDNDHGGEDHLLSADLSPADGRIREGTSCGR